MDQLLIGTGSFEMADSRRNSLHQAGVIRQTEDPSVWRLSTTEELITDPMSLVFDEDPSIGQALLDLILNVLYISEDE
jgi:hypothetical protein